MKLLIFLLLRNRPWRLMMDYSHPKILFCESLESIQKQYIIINDSLQIIVDKEKELVNTRSKFQELMMWNQNINIPGITQFTELE
jgi:hypothetical protein